MTTDCVSEADQFQKNHLFFYVFFEVQEMREIQNCAKSTPGY